MDDKERSKEDLIAELQHLRHQNMNLELTRNALWKAFPTALVVVGVLDGEILYVNQQAKQLYGEDYLGHNLDFHFRQTNPTRSDGSPFSFEELPAFRSLMYGETVHNVEMVIQNVNGAKCTMLVSSSPVFDEHENVTAAIVTFDDITNLKLAKTNLTEAAKLTENRMQELHAAIHALPVDLIVYDKNGKVLDINGCKDDFLLNHLPNKDNPLADKTAQIQGYQVEGQLLTLEEMPVYRSLVNGETVRDFEIITWKESGEHIYLSVNCSPIRNRKGEITGAVATHRDTTERKRIEAALLKSRQHALELVDSLRQVDQSKNAFINMLSHELRNPLATAAMGAELIKRMQNDSDRVERLREIVHCQLKQLSCLLDDLLDVAHITENKIVLNLKTVELNKLVNQAIESYRWEFKEKGVDLQTEFTKPLFMKADPERLTQAVEKLLHNAVKFTERGDAVAVTVSRAESNQGALITVCDTGMGMDREMLLSAFKPFLQVEQSLDRKRGGLGLGLSIVKGILELHGGDITVNSEGLGKGTQFSIWLPLSRQEEDEVISDSDETSADSLKILVIDDMPDITEIMTALLTHLGHEVMSAASGIEGITIAKEFRPQVLFCDIGLPGMNGYEVAEYFRADDELKDTYMIAFSGYAQQEDKLRSQRAGYKVHLAKPVEMELLKKVLDTCCQSLKSPQEPNAKTEQLNLRFPGN